MRRVISFNHISVSQEEAEKLKRWYHYYHKQYTCYKWKYKRLKRLYLSLKVTGIGLIVVGTVAGAVTFNPIVLGVISGTGTVIEGYVATRKLSRSVEMCRFAYTSYKKILIQLRSYLRGLQYDEVTFLTDCKVIEDSIIDLCPPIDGLLDKYHKTFDSFLVEDCQVP